MARLKVKQISDFVSATNSLITDGQVAVDGSIDSLESQVSSNYASLDSVDTDLSNDIDAVSDALSAEISTTNEEVISLDKYADDLSADLSAEISTTNEEVISLDKYADDLSADLSAEVVRAGSVEDVISADLSDVSVELSSEVASIDTRLDAADSGIGSLDAALDGFAKEAYIHGVFSDIVTGGGMTAGVFDTTGAQLDGGVNATELAGAVVIDLVNAVEGNNDKELEANLVFVTINGQTVNHDAIRFGGARQFTVDGTKLGFDLEADDVLEFKYIRD